MRSGTRHGEIMYIVYHALCIPREVEKSRMTIVTVVGLKLLEIEHLRIGHGQEGAGAPLC